MHLVKARLIVVFVRLFCLCVASCRSCRTGCMSVATLVSIYVIANDDGLLHTYATFFVAGGTQNNPRLSYVQNVNTPGELVELGFEDRSCAGKNLSQEAIHADSL